MKYKFYYIRFVRYCKKHGLLHGLRRVMEKSYQTIFMRNDFVFYTDLAQSNEQPLKLPGNTIVEPIYTYSQLEDGDLQALFRHVGKEIILYQMRHRFSLSATLWVIKVDNNLVGYLWSAGQSDFGPYYFPLGENDVFLFDGAILEEYRGKNIYPLLLSNAIQGLKNTGTSRVVFDAHSWNDAVIRTFLKIKAKKLGTVKKYKIGKRNFILWMK